MPPSRAYSSRVARVSPWTLPAMNLGHLSQGGGLALVFTAGARKACQRAPYRLLRGKRGGQHCFPRRNTASELRAHRGPLGQLINLSVSSRASGTVAYGARTIATVYTLDLVCCPGRTARCLLNSPGSLRPHGTNIREGPVSTQYLILYTRIP